MSNNKKFIAILFAGVVLALFVSQRFSSPKPSYKIVRQALALPADRTLAEVSAAQVAKTPGERGSTPASQKVDKETLHWFAMESQRIESRDVDILASEQEMKERAARLGPEEINYLAIRATSPLAPASERILASYLLGLAGEKSSEALVKIASQAIENPGPHEVHSVDEARVAQERAYKIMSVDAIVKSDSEVSRKIQQLQAIMSKTPDVTIKRYAADKVDELHGTF